MKSRFSLFLLALYLFPATVLTAQNTRERLKEIMQQYHDFNMFDGAVLVADQGKIVYQDAFGYANREWLIPNRSDTKFMIGSISKPLTAALVLTQVQKGRIQLDKTLGDYLPEYKLKPSGPVSIRQLLSHTSGIPNYDIIKDFFPRISRQHFSREEYIRVFIDSALAFPPGKQYAYSSWGYFMLGYILEKVSGKSYAALMEEEIFRPAGMMQSGSYAHTQVVPNRASGYDYSLEGFTSADFRDQSNTMGTGDIYSTVEDLYQFDRALASNKLFSASLAREMFNPGMAPAQYGLGWFNKTFKYANSDSAASNFHLGMTDGFISFIRRIPASNRLVVILCNSSPTDFFGISNNLLNVLQGIRVNIKSPVHKKMERIIREKGIKEALEEYPAMKLDTATYYIDWISMNAISQKLADAKRWEEARFMAEWNATEFPKRDLVLYTLGTIYQSLNRREDAIQYFRKTLEISPFYEEAKNRLKELGVH